MTKWPLSILAVSLLCLAFLSNVATRPVIASDCISPPSGLVSWWPGDGNPGDIQGGNDGTLTNDVTYGDGMVGPAFQFDGDKDAVVVGNPANLQLQDFTIDAWVKRANPNEISIDRNGNGQIFAYGSGGYGFGLLQVSTNCQLFLTKVNFSAVLSSGSLITDLSYHHVAVTKSNSVVVFYVDGVGAIASAFDPGFSFTTPAAIGARGDVTNSLWGSLDEVEVFNRALSTAEIQAIYNAGAAGKCKPTGLIVSPATGLNSSGFAGGPFNPSNQIYSLLNSGRNALNWSAGAADDWVSLSITNGTLGPASVTNVTVTINASANNLVPGIHSNTVTFTNLTNGNGTTNRSVVLTISCVPPTATVGGGGPICAGGATNIQAELTGVAPWTLYWSDGLVQSNILISPVIRLVSPPSNTTYTVTTVLDADCSGIGSNSATVVVTHSPTITSQPSSATRCLEDPVTFSVVATVTSASDARSGLARVGSRGVGASAGSMAAPAKATTFRSDRILVKPKKGLRAAQVAPQHARLGVQVERTFLAIGDLQIVNLPAGLSVEQAIENYQRSGLVEYAEPDYELHALLTPNDPRYTDGTLWAMNNTGQNGGTVDADIDAPEAWDTRTSANPIIVAVIDTGVRYTHEDLAANMWTNPGEIPGNGIDDDGDGYVDDVHGINAINNSGNPWDDHFHGSHVSGTIGGVGNNGKGVVGVAWNVRLMACKFLDASGSGYSSDAIKCIDYARSKGAKIMSNSWGGGGYDSALRDAIIAARDADIIFVAAAGNSSSDNDSSPTYPASFDVANIVAVAATDRNDALASFSNYGAASVELGAPGVDVYSCDNSSDDGYRAANGTSMATPHVSGALAMLRAQFPELNYSNSIAELLATVDPIPSLTGKTISGGRLNLQKLLTHYSPLLGYQWRKNTLPIIGATNASYTIPSVSYGDAGSYDVVVTNACGQTVSSNAILTVTNCFVAPVANFSAVPTNGAAPLMVTFTDTSTGTVTNRLWSFGDGATTNVSTVSVLHTYAAQGNYTVALTASGPAGSDTVTKANLIAVGPVAPCVSAPPGLVSWWPGDGNPGDIRGGNDGTLTNDVTYGDGMVGPAFQFDGDKDAVVVGNPANLRLQDFTIDAWVKRTDPNEISIDRNGNGQIFAYGSGGYGFGLLQVGTNCQLFLTKVDFSAVLSGGPLLTDLNYHHVAVTKSNSVVIFYVDGVAAVAPAFNPGFSFTSPAAIGARGDVTNSILGSLDEVEIFNRALSTPEIQAIYNAGAGGKCKLTGLAIDPATGFSSGGPAGGPFSPPSQLYTLSNVGSVTLNWAANKSADWMDLSLTGGALAAGATTSMVVSINANANTLPAGTYSDGILFTNLTSGVGSTNRSVSLTVTNRGAFFDDVENGTNGWTASGLWHIVGTGGCSNWFSPTHSWYYGSDATCTYNNGTTNSGDLISPRFVVPMSGNLTFQSWEQTEGITANWDKRLIYISTNGAASWIQLLQSINNAAAWHQKSIDLSGYAGKTAQLRFRFDTVDALANDYRGWYVDDVRVEAAPTLVVTPATSLNASGEQGGPFTPPSQLYTLSNAGDSTLTWSANAGDPWLSVSATSGTLGVGATTNVTVSINAAANALEGGLYSDVVSFINTVNGKGNADREATLLVRDGISDEWRFTYWHHVEPRADDQSRAQDDPDGDGTDNLHEFLAGTDPTDSASMFHILSIVPEGDSVRVTWLAGSGRTNVVQATSGGPGGSYSNAFIDISGNLFINGVGDQTTNYLDAGATTNWPSRYYRIRIAP